MTVTAITSAPGRASAAAHQQSLGQADFIRLLTTQLKQQDPTDPVDNKDTIAQMAQFSSLAGIDDINTTLQAVTVRLDRLIALQTPPAAQE